MEPHAYKFFLRAKDAWDGAYAACEGAKRSILFENFILVDDSVGRRFIDLFKKKAREGVKVRLLLDAVGSSELLHLHLDNELERSGAELVFFNSVIPGMLSHRTPWFFRDHRKLIVVDSEIAFTGGVCFQEHMADWRETTARAEGPVAEEMEQAFDEMWEYAHKRGKLSRERVRLGGARKHAFLGNAPLPRRRHLYHELLERVRSAKERIFLTTAYFAPNRRLLRALLRAARRGVTVRLLLPRTSDIMLINIASRSYFDRLLRAGVRIFLYGPEMLHAKAAVIDGFGTVGSMNLDHLSLQYNFEGNLVSSDDGFVGALRRQFDGDSAEAEEVTLAKWRARPWHDRLLEYAVRPVRFLL
ncbi:MAG: phospholipase D-like domain-containing protein [bacterium]|nr:phospholipase D-like domain-containing protein [bacterium]